MFRGSKEMKTLKTYANVQGEQQSKENQEKAKEINTERALVIRLSEEKTLEEPPTKSLKVLIPTPTPLKSILPDLPREPSPPRIQAGKLRLSPPYELTTFRLTFAEKKRKRTFEMIEQVFVKEDNRVARMERNLIPPLGVVGSPGLVITEPKAGISYYNGNFDLRDIPEGREMVKKLQFAIKASDDVNEARRIVNENIDDGLMTFKLIRNPKVYEIIIKKDSKIVKAKGEMRSLAIKAKNESSDEECLTSRSKDEEYAMAVRDFKKFFKRTECQKPPKDKNQRAFVGGSWSDSDEEDDEKAKDGTCLMARASNEWIKDSGCSKHITGNQNLFSTYKAYNGGNIIFDSNLRDNIIGKGPSTIWSYEGNLYTLVIVDDYSRVERKNRSLQEMSRTMLNEQSLPQKFWCNTVNTSTYILNRILVRAILGKTPYELLRGRKPTLDYFSMFGSKCFILNTKDYLTKFDPKLYEGIFLGYSQNSKAYIILNKHTMKIKKSLNVTFDETPPQSKTSPLVGDDLDREEVIKATQKNLKNDIEDETLEIDKVVNIKESRNHPLENVIGNFNQRTLRSQDQNQSNLFCFISTIEPKNVNDALTDESCIIVMQEELNQFIANNVWELVPQPKNMTIIGTKWVFENKLDENGVVSRNKASLEDSKPMKTPISSNTKLTKDEECESVDSNKYRGMIELSNGLYVLYDHVMYPLAAQQQRKTRKDYGMRRRRSSISSSSAFGQPSSSRPNDDDNDGNDEGTSRASTPFTLVLSNH
nr:retrovirus-related Pol polyprotein from transposon TNT 1-94 [Tanacetum cinerariifolium]